MAFTIQSLLADTGDALYYDQDFRLVLETHLNILRVTNVEKSVIPNDKVYQYEGNFYGYLVEIGVPHYLHWLYLRVNGMTNPNQFGKEMRDPQNRQVAVVLTKPNHSTVASIRSLYLTKKK